MEATPLVGDKRRSVFAADQRRTVNGVAIVLNAFLPWILFSTVFFLWSFRFHFEHGTKLVWVALVLALIVAVPTYATVHFRRQYLDPMWWGYTTVMLLFASCAGVALGNENYSNNMWFFYKYDSLQVYPLVDVGRELGVHLLDAGRVYFGSNAKIDGARSWHFKDGTLYCVAPVISSAGQETSSVDFWAVGTDCCSQSASDFRCGEYANGMARSGLRLLDESVLPNFRLAAEQACTLYGMHTTNPLFFIWTQDPVEDVMVYRNNGWTFFGLAIGGFLVLSVVAACLAAWRFAYIGRGEEQLEP